MKKCRRFQRLLDRKLVRHGEEERIRGEDTVSLSEKKTSTAQWALPITEEIAHAPDRGARLYEVLRNLTIMPKTVDFRIIRHIKLSTTVLIYGELRSHSFNRLGPLAACAIV